MDQTSTDEGILQSIKALFAVLITWIASMVEWFFNGGSNMIISVCATLTSIAGLIYMVQGIRMRQQFKDDHDHHHK